MSRTSRIVLGTLLFTAIFAVWIVVGEGIPVNWVVALDHAGIVFGYILSCLAAVGVVLSLPYLPAIRQAILRLLRRRKFEGTGHRLEVDEEKVEAVVLPVSPTTDAQPRYILNHLRPKRAALLYTHASQNNAASIAGDMAYQQVDFLPDRDGILRGDYMIGDHLRPVPAKNMTRLFLEQFLRDGYEPDKIFVDITAGTVPISVGAFQAAEELGVSSIYVVGKVKGMIKDPADKAQGDTIFISRHTA